MDDTLTQSGKRIASYSLKLKKKFIATIIFSAVYISIVVMAAQIA